MTGKSGPKTASAEMGITIFTIGHSTRALDEFVSLLLAHGVTRLVDVRTVPRSRHNPQFNRDTLPEILASEGIGYTHMPGLGGLRHSRADSPNKGWRTGGFRGFADYMQTDEFACNIEKLMEFGKHERIAVMCAEAVPWRCHRSLIADALLVRGVSVVHIMGKTSVIAHALTRFARVDGTRVTYPAGEEADRDQR